MIKKILIVALSLNKYLLNNINGFKMFLGIVISPSVLYGEESFVSMGGCHFNASWQEAYFDHAN